MNFEAQQNCKKMQKKSQTSSEDEDVEPGIVEDEIGGDINDTIT